VHHPDPARPVVFPLWRKGASVELLTSSAFLKIENIDPNRVHTVNLLEDRIMPGLLDEGDVVVEVYNEGAGTDAKGRNLRQQYDWEVKLSLPGGGIVQTNDPYLYRAPEAGYQEQLVFRSNKADKDWTPIMRGNYYFRDGQGRYGKLHLEVRARGQDAVVSFEDVAMNSSGSRNLQPKHEEETPLSASNMEALKDRMSSSEWKNLSARQERIKRTGCAMVD
jgi:hypothetical protein